VIGIIWIFSRLTTVKTRKYFRELTKCRRQTGRDMDLCEPMRQLLMNSRTNRIRLIIRVYPIGLASQASMAALSLN